MSFAGIWILLCQLDFAQNATEFPGSFPAELAGRLSTMIVIIFRGLQLSKKIIIAKSSESSPAGIFAKTSFNECKFANPFCHLKSKRHLEKLAQSCPSGAALSCHKTIFCFWAILCCVNVLTIFRISRFFIWPRHFLYQVKAQA